MLSITTESLAGYGLDRAFEIAAAAKLDGIEVSIQHGQFDTFDAEYIRSLSDRHKMPIIALSAPANMSSERASKAANLAADIRAPLLTIMPPEVLDFDYKKWIREEMKVFRKKKKIKIALVNPPSKAILGIIPKYSINNFFELKKMGDVALDTSNTLGKSQPLLEVYGDIRDSLHHIYLSNARREADHLPFSTGVLPIESLLTRLARDNFDGNLVIRIDPKKLGVGNIEKVLQNIEESKKFVEKYFRKN